jgi:hypothetical protein
MPPAAGQEATAVVAADAGIEFSCAAEELPRIENDMAEYLAELKIAASLYSVARDADAGKLRYTLSTAPEDKNTLDLATRPEFAIARQIDWLPDKGGRLRRIVTVSPREIVLALMQHGRLTEFSGSACTVGALREHVGIRRNIVAWAEVLEWGWPDGGAARWNRRYWQAGTPKRSFPLRDAINDAFFNQKQYEIGCYTATKLIVVQGILDYFHRVRKDPARAAVLETRLLADDEPLAAIEPRRMWNFEPDFDPRELERAGKLLRISNGIAAKNFVPGDWSYFLNNDPATYARTGYEGSNPIYLGSNRFVDYYNENAHAFSFEEKIDGVFQWRNGVFNRQRDRNKITPLSPADYERLSQAPEKGGLLTTLRATPYYFGFEELPAATQAQRSKLSARR